MTTQIVWGLLLPFMGTVLGAGCVFFLRRQLRRSVQRVLAGFAAGVMVAASVWSLLIPALEQAEAAPPAKARRRDAPSASRGRETMAPSGKFWMAMPSDRARAPAAEMPAPPVSIPA